MSPLQEQSPAPLPLEDFEELRKHALPEEELNDPVNWKLFKAYEKLEPLLDVLLSDQSITRNEFLFVMQAMQILGVENTIRHRALVLQLVDKDIQALSSKTKKAPPPHVIKEAQALFASLAGSAAPQGTEDGAAEEDEKRKRKEEERRKAAARDA